MANFARKNECCKFTVISKFGKLIGVNGLTASIFIWLQKICHTSELENVNNKFIAILSRLILFIYNWIKDFKRVPLVLKPAMTVCELIIVTGTVGTVAMLTIPPFISQQYTISTVVALKNSYAISTNAFNKAILENGSPDTWGLGSPGDSTGLANINDIMAQNFKVNKNCITGPGCFPDETYKNLKGIDNATNLNQDTSYTKMRLLNGTSIAVTQLSSDCSTKWGDSSALQSVCGIVYMDINGESDPNQYGLDMFGFALTKTGLVPLGSPMQNNYPFNGFCNRTSNANFKYENGLSCTAWVMYNENLDYRKCSGLGWQGKTECKP